MRTREFFISFVALIFVVTAAGAQNKVQTIFNLEESVSKNVSIPDAVIAVLKSDKRVDACFRENGGGEINEAQWFEASEIDLNADRRMDLVIKAKNGCLFGANQGPFWIFQNVSDGYQQVFSASGLQLAVLPKKVNSFNQIKISKAVAMKAASRIFSFKNGKYQ